MDGYRFIVLLQGFMRVHHQNYTEPAKHVAEKDENGSNAGLVCEIDRTMKKHADNVMHALEGVSARISQLESRSHNLENSMDDLKVAVGNNQGSTDGKLRHLESILREVQSGVEVIRDKQDILEGQLHLAKLQGLAHPDSFQQNAPPGMQSHESHHQQLSPPQPSTFISHPNPPPASQQVLPPQNQLPNQHPPNQIPPPPLRDPYHPSPIQPQENTTQQYPPQASLSSPQYPPAPPQYSQQHPSLSSINPTQPQLPPSHHPEDSPYPPPQNYPQSPCLSGYPPNPANSSPQQLYGASQMYEPPSIRLGSGYSPTYGPSSGPDEVSAYQYGGPPSQYGGGGMKQQVSSSQGGGNSYPQLPNARVLPQALPTASGVGGSSAGSSGSGNRVPIDDVVDKVTSMGFSREQVRATVRKLTENGQSVDLNIVLDKLMTDGVEQGQPPRGWFGR